MPVGNMMGGEGDRGRAGYVLKAERRCTGGQPWLRAKAWRRDRTEERKGAGGVSAFFCKEGTTVQPVWVLQAQQKGNIIIP